jgi:hypothetical protein
MADYPIEYSFKRDSKGNAIAKRNRVPKDDNEMSDKYLKQLRSKIPIFDELLAEYKECNVSLASRMMLYLILAPNM